jgi:hypothetical protein
MQHPPYLRPVAIQLEFLWPLAFRNLTRSGAISLLPLETIEKKHCFILNRRLIHIKSSGSPIHITCSFILFRDSKHLAKRSYLILKTRQITPCIPSKGFNALTILSEIKSLELRTLSDSEACASTLFMPYDTTSLREAMLYS